MQSDIVKPKERLEYLKSKGFDYIAGDLLGYSTNLIILECENGHQFKTRFSQVRRDRGCRQCWKDSISEARSLPFEEVKKRITERGYQLLSNDYKNSLSKLVIVCPNGHKIKMSLNNFRVNDCQLCEVYHTEERIRESLLKLTGLEFKKIWHKDIRNPKTNRPLQLDGFNEETMRAFEFDGIHHFKQMPRRGNLKDIQYRDQIKNQRCVELGIDLLRIAYVDYQNYEQVIKEKRPEWLCNQF